MKKVAIVTGASGNLGKAVVKKFLDENYQVIGLNHKKNEQEFSTDSAMEEIVIDLRNEEECKEKIEGIVNDYKRIDVAVLTAGGFAMGDISTTSSDGIHQQFQLNFETAYHIARPVFLQMMTQNSGRIFLIGSRAGLEVSNAKGVIAYALSKSLLFRLAEIMNAEGKKKNVVVSVIVPSIIDTPQNRQSMPVVDFNHWVKASEIADIIYFYSENTATAIREPVIKVYNQS
ncbi:MAG: SDR family NAD(P)-dependent oxidoreductase [Ginsengibacter sp.]